MGDKTRKQLKHKAEVTQGGSVGPGDRRLSALALLLRCSGDEAQTYFGQIGKASDSMRTSMTCRGFGGDTMMGLCLGQGLSWQVDNALDEGFPGILGSGSFPPPLSLDNYPS